MSKIKIIFQASLIAILFYIFIFALSFVLVLGFNYIEEKVSQYREIKKQERISRLLEESYNLLIKEINDSNKSLKDNSSSTVITGFSNTVTTQWSENKFYDFENYDIEITDSVEISNKE